MAYLNVRERRIEAKIAYVGPHLAGKATNFDRLRDGSGDARIAKVQTSSDATSARLSLSWLPGEAERFRDCDVVVELVAPRGAFGDPARALLHEADGVVVVMDADPTAQERNRESLSAVRAALSKAQRSEVPVVVQINKADLPGALSADAVAAALEASSLPRISAVATQGQGVVETLAKAVEGVLAAMQREGSTGTKTTDEDPTHPLLEALREVMRSTVREHLEDVAAKVAGRLETSLTRLERRVKTLETTTEAAVLELRNEVGAISIAASMNSDDDDKTPEVETAPLPSPETIELMELVGRLNEQVELLGARVELLAKSNSATAPRLQDLETTLKHRSARVEDVVRALRTDFSGSLGNTEQRLTTMQTRVDELVEELKRPKRGWFT